MDGRDLQWKGIHHDVLPLTMISFNSYPNVDVNVDVRVDVDVDVDVDVNVDVHVNVDVDVDWWCFLCWQADIILLCSPDYPN